MIPTRWYLRRDPTPGRVQLHVVELGPQQRGVLVTTDAGLLLTPHGRRYALASARQSLVERIMLSHRTTARYYDPKEEPT